MSGELLLTLLLPLSLVFSQGPCVEGVIMYSLLVTVLLLATAANNSGGQGAKGTWGGGTSWYVQYMFPLTGAQVPITNYTCTQPNLGGFLDHKQCTVNSSRFRMCASKEGARPALLSSNDDLGVYAWDSNTNPFVVLDIPYGWCVGSVKLTFRSLSSISALSIQNLSLSVHSAERLSTNIGRTLFTTAIDRSYNRAPFVIMNLTIFARGKYLRINMASIGRLYLREIEVFGTSRYAFTDTRNLHDMHVIIIADFTQFVLFYHR